MGITLLVYEVFLCFRDRALLRLGVRKELKDPECAKNLGTFHGATLS